MHIQKASIVEAAETPALGTLTLWPMVVSRTVPLPGRRAKLRLESAVWSGLDEIARMQRRPVQELCKDVDARRPPGTPLTSAIRSYVLDYFREAEAR